MKKTLWLLLVATMLVLGCARGMGTDMMDGSAPAPPELASAPSWSRTPLPPPPPTPREQLNARLTQPQPAPPPDSRSPEQIAQAACMGANRVWHCKAPKPIVFAATGAPPITPVSWSVPNWYTDPQNSTGNASDTNNCTTALTPCLTKAQIASRWGTWSPLLQTVVTFTWLSSETTFTDPGLFYPTLGPGGNIFYTAPRPAASFTGTINNIWPKVRSLSTSPITLAGTASVQNGLNTVTFSQVQTIGKGAVLKFASQLAVAYFASAATTASTSLTLTANYTGVTNAATTTNLAEILQTSFTTATGAMAANLTLVNSTHNSVAIAQREVDVPNGIWQITQPMLPYAGTGFNPGTEVDTWTSGDTITGYTRLQANLPVTNNEYSVSVFAVVPTIWQLDNIATVHEISAGYLQVTEAGLLSSYVHSSGLELSLVNAFAGSSFLADTSVFGGAVTGGYAKNWFGRITGSFSSDVILGGSSNNVNNCSFNTAALDTGGGISCNGGAQNGNPLYGPGTFTANGGIYIYKASGAAQQFQIGAISFIPATNNAYPFQTGDAGVATVYNPVVVSPAALDTAPPTGFGGYATFGGVTLSDEARP